MSRFRRYEIVEVSPSFCINQDIADFALDLLSPPPFPSPFETFIQIDNTPFYPPSTLLLKHQIQTLNHRVAALELGFDRLSKVNKPKLSKPKIGERKYTWTTEIKSPEENGVDQKYKWVAEVKDGNKNGPKNNNYKFTAEIKGKGDKSPITKTYRFEAFSGNASDSSDKSDKKGDSKQKIKKANSTRIVEITDAAPNHGAVVLRQAFSKRIEKIRGKQRYLSPQDAAALIQMSFRAYLIRRSQALRALRELAIAKTKLKELRALFNNITYRRRIARDAEEQQRFTEKIIVLLLTVDAIEGADVMVRSAKKSMVDELEAMLDVVDPQPAGRSQSMRKRTFKKANSTRAVEITDAAPNHGAVVLRRAFSKRVEKIRGKQRYLSPQDAAALIQMSFRAYMIRRSQALRALRELAIAKTKLKELRALFNNFTYRRRIARDAEEQQRFTEKIIVLLLTVDAIEGADVMVRSAKKSMVDELEDMLDVVDPQPAGRSQSMRKRTFDMPDAAIQKELAAGVTQIVQMLEEDASASEDIEA